MSGSPIIKGDADGVVIQVRVAPRSGRRGADGVRDGALLVRLNAAPVDGAANEELIALLADLLHVARRSVTILSGERARAKRVRVSGVTAADARLRLGAPDV